MAIKVTLTLRDSKGRITQKRIETADTTLAGAQSSMVGYCIDLNALTDLELLYVTYSLRDDAEEFEGVADSNVDVGATFSVLTEDGKGAAHKIPGFPMDKVGGQGTIDVEDADVVEYFSHFKDPLMLRLSDGEQVDQVLTGVLDR